MKFLLYRILINIFFIIMMYGFFIPCQETHSSAFTSLFDQDNQTYSWDTAIRYNYSPTDRLSFALDGKILSTLIKKSLIAGGENQWQEDRKVRSRLIYDFSRKLGISTQFYQGYNSLGNRSIHDSEIITLASYRPNKWIQLSYGLGATASSRKEDLGNRLDRGAKMSWGAVLSHTVFGSDNFSAGLSVGENLYREIPSSDFSFNGKYIRSHGGIDSLMIQYEEFSGKKTYYASSYSLSGTNTQTKHERALDGKLIRRVPLGMEMTVDADFAFNEYLYSADDDTISGFSALRDRDNSRFSYDMLFKLSREQNLANRPLELFLSYRYTGYDENYGLDERDQISSYGEIGGGFVCAVTGYDTVTLDIYTGVRAFDHPYELAPQADRDVVSELINLSYYRFWSKYLVTDINFGYRNFHQIYVSRYSSADNNRNYTYLLSPQIIWYLTDRLTIRHFFEIQANYITYDFEKKLLSSRNRIFRRGDSKSTVNLEISSKTAIKLEYGYRYEDYGQLLFDKEWQQLTSWDRRTHLGFIGFEYNIFSRLMLSPGYSYDYRREWEHTEKTDVSDETVIIQKIRKMKDRQDQRIVSLHIEYRFSELEKFSFNAGRRIINGWRRGHIRDDNFTISLMRIF
ncbi:MAG: hypothetical protein GY855_08445 [candidate division Zixibacteria bacterium]|nr:hypothetical protein [candidate division Zixibacteria bacterium]